jgi:hypothetical protein
MANKNNIKSEVLLLHIDHLEKDLLIAAAARSGKTLTEFVADAALHQARSSEYAASAPMRDGVPGWFRDLCDRGTLGGPYEYATAGFELVNAVLAADERLERPHQCKSDIIWQRLVRELHGMLRNHIRASDRRMEIVSWLDTYLPNYMALIPERRRIAFMTGVLLYSKQHGQSLP